MVQVRIGGRVVDQSRDLALPHLAGTEAKDEQQGVDDVGFARAVGSHDGREGGVEGADLLAARVALEVVEDEVGDDDARLGPRLLDHGHGDLLARLEDDVHRPLEDGVHGLDGLELGHGVVGGAALLVDALVGDITQRRARQQLRVVRARGGRRHGHGRLLGLLADLPRGNALTFPRRRLLGRRVRGRANDGGCRLVRVEQLAGLDDGGVGGDALPRAAFAWRRGRSCGRGRLSPALGCPASGARRRLGLGLGRKVILALLLDPSSGLGNIIVFVGGLDNGGASRGSGATRRPGRHGWVVLMALYLCEVKQDRVRKSHKSMGRMRLGRSRSAAGLRVFVSSIVRGTTAFGRWNRWISRL
ncbi:hypothetical protein GGR56DRAFT_524873 [Xylariaceae sp. FL0804]|nr:hypothetical protein GGR56DRAFT_524873 [Xylariaceae sp. FL0804]